jgi:hypothetical protein
VKLAEEQAVTRVLLWLQPTDALIERKGSHLHPNHDHDAHEHVKKINDCSSLKEATDTHPSACTAVHHPLLAGTAGY